MGTTSSMTPRSSVLSSLRSSAFCVWIDMPSVTTMALANAPQPGSPRSNRALPRTATVSGRPR